MSSCEMYVVSLRDRAVALLCGNCGGLALNTDAAFCPFCGAEVTSVEDDGDEWEGETRLAHDVGFDEGWQAAMDEMGASNGQ